jgi:hypothetical protein
VSYLTDGVHVYEQFGSGPNFGRAGGGGLTVRECLPVVVRSMSGLELALCERVPSPQTSR